MLFVWGVRSSLLKAVYLERKGKSRFWDGINESRFAENNLKQLVEEGRRAKVRRNNWGGSQFTGGGWWQSGEETAGQRQRYLGGSAEYQQGANRSGLETKKREHSQNWKEYLPKSSLPHMISRKEHPSKSRKAEHLTGVTIPAPLAERILEKSGVFPGSDSEHVCPLHGTWCYSSFLFTLWTYEHQKNGEADGLCPPPNKTQGKENSRCFRGQGNILENYQYLLPCLSVQACELDSRASQGRLMGNYRLQWEKHWALESTALPGDPWMFSRPMTSWVM